MPQESLYTIVPRLVARFNALFGFEGDIVTAENIYDVPTAKREQVAADILAKVQAGGQAMIQELDTSYLAKTFKDNRTPDAPCRFTCDQEVNPATGETELWWNRIIIS